MADSDEEFGNRRERSHKFRSEREPPRFDDNRRGDWSGDGRGDSMRGGWNRQPGRDDRFSRDNYGRSRDRYSPREHPRDMSPPSKRMRGRDYDDRSYSDYGSSHSYDHRRDSGRDSSSTSTTASSENCPTQPIMLTFKQFLHRLDDDVADSDAVKKYNEYKSEFKKKQAKDFFEKHKDEEWYVLFTLLLINRCLVNLVFCSSLHSFSSIESNFIWPVVPIQSFLYLCDKLRWLLLTTKRT